MLRWRVPMSLEGSRRTAITNEIKKEKMSSESLLGILP